MTKKMLCFCVGIISALFIVFSYSVNDVRASQSERCLEELVSIVQSLIERDSLIFKRSFYDLDLFAYENLHLHPSYHHVSNAHIDRRVVSIGALASLFMEAAAVQEQMRGNFGASLIITGWGVNTEPYRRRFMLSLSSERYFELLCFISDFTGIEPWEIDLDVMPPLELWPLLFTVDELCEAYNIEITPLRTTLTMGTLNTIRWGNVAMSASLGHTSNAAGTFAYLDVSSRP